MEMCLQIVHFPIPSHVMLCTASDLKSAPWKYLSDFLRSYFHSQHPSSLFAPMAATACSPTGPLWFSVTTVSCYWHRPAWNGNRLLSGIMYLVGDCVTLAFIIKHVWLLSCFHTEFTKHNKSSSQASYWGKDWCRTWEKGWVRRTFWWNCVAIVLEYRWGPGRRSSWAICEQWK